MSDKIENVYFTAYGSGTKSGNDASNTLPMSALGSKDYYKDFTAHIYNKNTVEYYNLKLVNVDVIGYTSDTFDTICPKTDVSTAVIRGTHYATTLSNEITLYVNKCNPDGDNTCYYGSKNDFINNTDFDNIISNNTDTLVLENCNVSGIYFKSFANINNTPITVKGSNNNLVNCWFAETTGSVYEIDLSECTDLTVDNCIIYRLTPYKPYELENINPYEYCIGGFYNRGIPDNNRNLTKYYYSTNGDLLKFKDCELGSINGKGVYVGNEGVPGAFRGIKYRNNDTDEFPCKLVNQSYIGGTHYNVGSTSQITYFFKLHGWGVGGKYNREFFADSPTATESTAYKNYREYMCACGKVISDTHCKVGILNDESGRSYDNALPLMDVYTLSSTEISEITAIQNDKNVKALNCLSIYKNPETDDDSEPKYCFHLTSSNGSGPEAASFKLYTALSNSGYISDDKLLYPGVNRCLTVKNSDSKFTCNASVSGYKRSAILPGGCICATDSFRFCRYDYTTKKYVNNSQYAYLPIASAFAEIDVSPRNIGFGSSCVRSTPGNVHLAECVYAGTSYNKVVTTDDYRTDDDKSVFISASNMSPITGNRLVCGITSHGGYVIDLYYYNDNVGIDIPDKLITLDKNDTGSHQYRVVNLEQHFNSNNKGYISGSYSERYTLHNNIDTQASGTVSYYKKDGWPSHVLKLHTRDHNCKLTHSITTSGTCSVVENTNIPYLNEVSCQGLILTQPFSSVDNSPIQYTGEFIASDTNLSAFADTSRYATLADLPCKDLVYIPNNVSLQDFNTGICVYGNNIILTNAVFVSGGFASDGQIITTNIVDVVSALDPTSYTYIGFIPANTKCNLSFGYTINGRLYDTDNAYNYSTVYAYSPMNPIRIGFTPFAKTQLVEQYNTTTCKYEPCLVVGQNYKISDSRMCNMFDAVLSGSVNSYMVCNGNIQHIGPIEVVQIPINPNEIDYGCTDAVLTISGISPESHTLTHKDSKLELVCNIKSNDYRAGNKFTYQWYHNNNLILTDNSNVYSKNISVDNNISSITGLWCCKVTVTSPNRPNSEYYTNIIDIKFDNKYKLIIKKQPQGGSTINNGSVNVSCLASNGFSKVRYTLYSSDNRKISSVEKANDEVCEFAIANSGNYYIKCSTIDLPIQSSVNTYAFKIISGMIDTDIKVYDNNTTEIDPLEQIKKNEPYILKCITSYSDGIEILSHSWYKNDAIIENESTDTINVKYTKYTKDDTYRCVVKYKPNNSDANTISSTLTANCKLPEPTVQVSINNANVELLPNGTCTLTVSVNSTDDSSKTIQYDWYLNNNLVKIDYANNNTSQYVINYTELLTQSKTDVYKCVATVRYGDFYTETATATCNVKFIAESNLTASLSTPYTKDLAIGSTLTFTCDASSKYDISYKWYLDDVEVLGVTGNTYTKTFTEGTFKVKCIASDILTSVEPEIKDITVNKDVVYVTVDGAGDKDGSSWSNACAGIQSGLKKSNGSNEIWVASGIYYNNGSPLSVEPHNTIMYGGFEGFEQCLDARNPKTEHLTYISGNESHKIFNTINTGKSYKFYDLNFIDAYSTSGSNVLQILERRTTVEFNRCSFGRCNSLNTHGCFMVGRLQTNSQSPYPTLILCNCTFYDNDITLNNSLISWGTGHIVTSYEESNISAIYNTFYNNTGVNNNQVNKLYLIAANQTETFQQSPQIKVLFDTSIVYHTNPTTCKYYNNNLIAKFEADGNTIDLTYDTVWGNVANSANSQHVATANIQPPDWYDGFCITCKLGNDNSDLYFTADYNKYNITVDGRNMYRSKLDPDNDGKTAYTALGSYAKTNDEIK